MARRTRSLVGSREVEVNWDRLAITAIGAGVIVRAVFAFGLHPPHGYLYSDMGGYVGRALQVAFGGGYGSRVLALYPPGTHLLLAGAFKLFGGGDGGLGWADAVWFSFSALGPVFAWRLVRLLLDPAAAALTAVSCALYPLFVLYVGFFTSETPSITLLCGALWLGYLAARSRPGVGLALGTGAGLLGGVLVAVRPQFILNLALVLAALVRGIRARWPAAVGFALGLIAVLTAIVAVNSSNAGHLTGVSENGGIQFYQAHCNIHQVFTGRAPAAFNFENPVAFSLQRGHDAHFPDHAAWDQGYFYDQGWKCIRADGLGHALILGRELTDLTVTSVPWPLSDETGLSHVGDVANILYCAALLGVILLMSLMRRRRTLDEAGWPGARTLLAHLAMVAPVTMVFGSEPRYRIPYDVFGLALVAWLAAHQLPARRLNPTRGHQA